MALATLFSLLCPFAASAALIPNDTFWGRQWYMRQVHAPEAWEVTTGSAEVIVALVDGGVDIAHGDLAPNIWTNTREIAADGLDNDGNGYVDDLHGWNYITDSSDVRPVRLDDQIEEAWSHGTITASLLGAVGGNDRGITGMAWKVRIMPLVVLDGEGNGSSNDVIQAIRYAVLHGAKIINLSLVGYEQDDELAELIERAHDAGVLVVAATGNQSEVPAGVDLDFTPAYPVCMDAGKKNVVIGVGGTDTLDQKAPYANYGHDCTDIVAPAQQLFAARPSYPHGSAPTSSVSGYLDDVTGTSLAAPLVSGVAALIRAVRPEWTVDQVRDRILDTADPIETLLLPRERGKMGRGRLNAGRALAGLMPEGGPAATSTQLIPASVKVEGNRAVLTRWDAAKGASTSTTIVLTGRGPWKVTILERGGQRRFALASEYSPYLYQLNGESGEVLTKAPYGLKVAGMRAFALSDSQAWLVFPTVGGGHALVFADDGRLLSNGFPLGKDRIGVWRLTLTKQGTILVVGPRGLRQERPATTAAWKAL